MENLGRVEFTGGLIRSELGHEYLRVALEGAAVLSMENNIMRNVATYWFDHPGLPGGTRQTTIPCYEITLRSTDGVRIQRIWQLIEQPNEWLLERVVTDEMNAGLEWPCWRSGFDRQERGPLLAALELSLEARRAAPRIRIGERPDVEWPAEG
jgi:hypothetical protein